MADPAVYQSPPQPARRKVVWLVVVLAAAAGVASYWWWTSPRPPAPPPAIEIEIGDEPDEPVEVRNPGYLGPDACAECHAPRVAEYRKTRHYRACWTPDPGPMPPGFAPGQASYIPRQPGFRFEFSHPGRDYVQTVVRDGPTGPQRHPLRIDLIYGSGGRGDEVFFTWKGDRLYELPMAWLHPTREWGEQPFDPDDPGDFTRTTTTRCVECHNTWFGHVPGTENQYHRDNLLLGVTCEKCHGPGRDHVAFHREHPGAAGNHAIVHPGRLPRGRQTDVCGQCHTSTTRARRPPFTYRPGDPLDTAFRVMAVQDRERDHVADQVRYLGRSKCFEKSDTLTCVTCHNPHRPADPAAAQAGCAKCHQPADCREQDRLPAAVRADCVACHMPRYNRVAIRFNTAAEEYVFPMRPREHRIAVYPAARDEVLLGWYRGRTDSAGRQKADELADRLTGYWLGECDRLRSRFRFLESIGAAREAVRINPTSAARARLEQAVAVQVELRTGLQRANRQNAAGQLPDAIRTLEGLLKRKPDWSEVHGKLGMLYATVGDRPRAVEHLTAVGEHDPDDPYGYNLLGWLAYLDGRAEEAVGYFHRADEIFPFTAEINYRWGLALLSLERWADAEARFRQVLAVDPNHAGGCQGLSHAVRKEGRAGDAVRFARRAAKLTRFQNADVLLTLADAYAAAGRVPEATAAASRALDVAGTGAPGLVPKIRSRLAELRRGG